MKKITALLIGCIYIFTASAQQQLHIHHINIENGDATLIGIYDVTEEKYTAKVLIDGGQLSPEIRLLPYIRKMIGSDKESFHFNYVILTHYHDDHYNGLLALAYGRITADSIIDPGGYKVNTVFNHTASSGTKPDSLLVRKVWLDSLRRAADATPEPFVKGRSKIMIQYGTNASTSISNEIILGKVGDHNVTLQCIAGWGNTLSDHDAIVSNPKPKLINGNNFTLAFVLRCGEFRYFIGGDMGGETLSKYINQETTVTKFFEETFPKAVSVTEDVEVKGHICGFKSNHHGSDHSNKSAFIEGMRPAITITSAGNNSSWHLPHPKYLDRLANVKPLSISTSLTDSTFNRGVYFTNLYNFSTGFPSKTKANTLFNNKPGTSYDFGNNTTTSKASYMIKVTDEENIDEQSSFEVGRVDITKVVPYKRLGIFFCHKR